MLFFHTPTSLSKNTLSVVISYEATKLVKLNTPYTCTCCSYVHVQGIYDRYVNRYAAGVHTVNGHCVQPSTVQCMFYIIRSCTCTNCFLRKNLTHRENRVGSFTCKNQYDKPSYPCKHTEMEALRTFNNNKNNPSNNPSARYICTRMIII